MSPLFAQLLVLFAQEGGIGKTIGGVAITLLGVGLGLFVVCRPGPRKEPKAAKPQPKAKA